MRWMSRRKRPAAAHSRAVAEAGPAPDRTSLREVDESLRRLQVVLAGGHSPDRARAAYGQAEQALVAAIRSRSAAATATDSATAVGGAGVGATAQVRLAEVLERLRFASLDQPGVHVPTTVRVRSHAATGPHIPGMDFDPHDPLDGAPGGFTGMGIDLAATVDTAPGRRALSDPDSIPRALPAAGHSTLDLVEECGLQSFPASDPPGWWLGHPCPPAVRCTLPGSYDDHPLPTGALLFLVKRLRLRESAGMRWR